MFAAILKIHEDFSQRHVLHCYLTTHRSISSLYLIIGKDFFSRKLLNNTNFNFHLTLSEMEELLGFIKSIFVFLKCNVFNASDELF